MLMVGLVMEQVSEVQRSDATKVGREVLDILEKAHPQLYIGGVVLAHYTLCVPPALLLDSDIHGCLACN
jgi:hypothetical protein